MVVKYVRKESTCTDVCVITNAEFLKKPLQDDISKFKILALRILTLYCDIQIRHLGADYMRRTGSLSRAGSVSRDLGVSVKHTKNQFSWAENLPCNHDRRSNTFWLLNFATEQNGSPEDRYFSFYITHKGLSDHEAT